MKTVLSVIWIAFAWLVVIGLFVEPPKEVYRWVGVFNQVKTWILSL